MESSSVPSPFIAARRVFASADALNPPKGFTVGSYFAKGK